MWTEHICKYCWQKAGKTIYCYDLRNTTQYRNKFTDGVAVAREQSDRNHKK